MFSFSRINAGVGKGVIGATLLSLAGVVGLVFANSPPPPQAESKYIGADACGKCHEAKSKGSQFTAWKGMKHAKAFETLATDAAKKIAKEKGIDDPQKADACLKCHVTGHGQPAERFTKSFEAKNGVQCESCHGPGESHKAARVAAAGEEDAEVPDGEIVKQPGVDACIKCHNEESPQFKPFCFKKRFDEIKHFDPRKKRTDAELAAMKCCCGEKCECKKGECGGLHDKK
ncbi:MAG: hypothetical protein HY719_10625 [Planctomycetes bacterium]|nr:hypothetical protein [Planctomycetota bacterium]